MLANLADELRIAMALMGEVSTSKVGRHNLALSLD